jgi:hypothetical protein
MLREITELRSQPGRRRKRWFSDDAMDLFTWCDAEGRIEAFQLTREAFAARAGQIDPHVRAFVGTKLADGESAAGAP